MCAATNMPRGADERICREAQVMFPAVKDIPGSARLGVLDDDVLSRGPAVLEHLFEINRLAFCISLHL